MRLRIFFLWLIMIIQVPCYAQNNKESTITEVQRLIDNGDNSGASEKLLGLLQSENPKIQATALRLNGDLLIKSDQLDSAEKTLSKALKISHDIYYQEELAQSLYLIGRISAFKGKFDRAQEVATKALYMAKKINNQRLEFSINNLLNWTYFMNEVDFNKVGQLEKRQAELVSLLDIKSHRALVFNNLGYNLTVSGLASLDSIINVSLIANNDWAEREKNKGRWYSLMNLTWQHRLANQLEKSVEYGQLSFAQAIKDDDRHAVVEASFQLAESLVASNRLGEAEGYYLTGLKWRGDENDRDGYVFDVYYSQFLWQKGERKQAINLLEKAIGFLETSEVFYEMHARMLLASYYFDEGRFENAQEQIEVIESPRHNYIAFETRCLAAITKAKLFRVNGRIAFAEGLLNSWLEESQRFQSDLLTEIIQNELREI
ncbi:MAG: hypothetical protein RJQ09_06085 [Cyclobacteriaceae bacterium]